MKPLLAAVLAVTLSAPALAAQAAPEPFAGLRRGALVRAVGPSTEGEPRVGRVAGVGDGSVVLATGWRGRRTLTLTPVDTLFVGSRRNHLGAAWAGLFGGAIIGAAAGAAIGFAAETLTEPTGDQLPPVGAGAVMGALAGAPLGAFIRGSQGFRVWTRVWPPAGRSTATGAAVAVEVTVAGRR